jgi:hypothetical protein
LTFDPDASIEQKRAQARAVRSSLATFFPKTFSLCTANSSIPYRLFPPNSRGALGQRASP